MDWYSVIIEVGDELVFCYIALEENIMGVNNLGWWWSLKYLKVKVGLISLVQSS